MSRANSTARRSSQAPGPSATAIAYAFVGPKCDFRNRKVGSENACLDEILYLPYDYDITAWTVHILVALYALATFVHIVQAIVSKRWSLLGTFALCGLCETLGWGGRWWSVSTTVWQASRGGYWSSEQKAYLLQVIALCIGPCFLAMGWYILLGRFIKILGPQYCRCTPTLLSWVLTGATVAAMAIEGAGGGIIAFAKELPAAQLGGMIMLAGLAFQLFIIICYVALFVEVAWRYSRDREAPSFRIRRTRPDDYLPKGSLSEYDVGKVKILMIANGVSVGLVFIRSCYRIVGLAGGPKGPLAGNELLFSMFDGGLVLLALSIFNFVHPLWFLPSLVPQSEVKAGNGYQDDESFFDKTPIGHRAGQSSQDSRKTISNWGFPKPKYTNQSEAIQEESEYVEEGENLECVPTNQRNTQLRPLYEGSVHHGRNDSR